ncbi:hypothetical protein [Mycobacterium sp. 1081908.1]|uniref:hypothetical protein n=1 Tax=Mycobacterium sp. 1081908.1 TaxID=1834066 RepID=UPI000A409AED|nr:hypothetical protein [Mycobacterium sp. 1081908.1]
MSQKARQTEVEIGDLLDERRELTAQLLRMTQGYMNATRPFHHRLAVIEAKLGKVPNTL